MYNLARAKYNLLGLRIKRVNHDLWETDFEICNIITDEPESWREP